MARNWIVQGDPTSSGGTVITGSPFTDIDGTPVARVTDQATCPRHKGAYPIVDGDNTLVVDGQPVALHGSSLACGCKVLSAQQVRVFVDAGGGGRSVDAGSVSKMAAIAAGAAVDAVARATTASQVDAEEAREYDEALRFCNEAGEALAGMRYTLHLENGETCSGVTDSNGVTERICTCNSQEFIKVVLAPNEPVSSCCRFEGGSPELDEIEIELEGLSTNDVEVGRSVATVTARGKDRALTEGEIAMARQVFGDSIDYKKVTLHNHVYPLTLGLQGAYTTIAPNGGIYFGRKQYREDFSSGDLRSQHLFIHEMTHVWQYQLGYPVFWTRVPRIWMSYDYDPDGSRRLHEYNMEKQGDILADYFIAVKVRAPYATSYYLRYLSENGFPPASDIASALESMVYEFTSDPSDTRNLPTTKK